MKPRLYCPECEAPAVTAVSLGFVANSGDVGTVDGFACAKCRHIWEAPDAVPMVTGQIDLGGRPALDFFLDRLARAGCDPQPRRAP